MELFLHVVFSVPVSDPSFAPIPNFVGRFSNSIPETNSTSYSSFHFLGFPKLTNYIFCMFHYTSSIIITSKCNLCWITMHEILWNIQVCCATFTGEMTVTSSQPRNRFVFMTEMQENHVTYSHLSTISKINYYKIWFQRLLIWFGRWEI